MKNRNFVIATFSLLAIGIAGGCAEASALSAVTPIPLEASSRAPQRRQILRRSVTRPALSPVSSPNRRSRSSRRFQPRSRQTVRPPTRAQRRPSNQRHRRQTNSRFPQNGIRPTIPRSQRSRQPLTKQYLAQAQLSCDDPQTQQELNRCAFQTLTQVNNLLNKTYRELVPNLSEQRQRFLVWSQTAWAAYRDRECRFYDSSAEGGSLQPLLSNGCKARLTRDRIRALQRYQQGLGSPTVPEGERISVSQLQQRYRQVQTHLTGARNTEYRELRSQLLRNAEQAWRQYRDRACRFEAIGGGNAARRVCNQWQTNRRYIQLSTHL